MASQFMAIQVRPASRDIARAGDVGLSGLLAEWPPAADEPTDYWLSTLSAGTPTAELARLARSHGRSGATTSSLSTVSATWHRYASLAALAQAFCTMIRTGPKAPAPGWLYQVLHEPQIVPAFILGTCPLCCQPLTPGRLAAALTGTQQSATRRLRRCR